MWKKLKYIFRPSWPLERSRWLNLTIPFFSVKVYFNLEIYMNLDLQILIKLTLMLISIFIAFIVISVVNPVYAVLALILLFFSASVLFIIQGAEFLAFIYLLVYVGALLILFLWV